MIDTATLIKSVFQTANLGTTGYVDEEEVNRNLAMVEKELFATLIPLNAKNFNIQSMLVNFLEVKSAETVTAGLFQYPAGYYEYQTANINGFPVYPKTRAEISLVLSSATRKPTPNGPYYSTLEKGGIQYYPKTLTAITELSYYRFPVYGEVLYTTVSNADSDYIEITTTVAMEWPESAFNILYYLLLEKYGVEVRESIALEYSQLGINKELQKL